MELSVYSPPLSAQEFNTHGIDLYIGSRCNRRCRHCFLTDEFLDSGQQMSLTTVEGIVGWAASEKSPISEITLLGGEPTLHPQFAEIVRVIAESGKGARVVTNGSPSYRRLLERYPQLRTQITRTSISIDSPTEEGHDSIRGKGTFKWVQDTAAYLRVHQMPFDVNYTLLRSHLGSVNEMIAFTESLGARRLNIHWYSLSGRGLDHAADEVPLLHEWREVLRQVADYKSNSPRIVVDCELGYAMGLPGEDLTMCAVRERGNLQFYPDGSVMSCGMLAEAGALSGYVWANGLRRRIDSYTEINMVGNSSCNGCPIRADNNGYRALCIYNRLETVG